MLKHDNIIKYHEFIKDEQKGIFVLVMEFFPSMTLEAFLKQNMTSISIEEKIFICKNLFETVLYLHSQKIAHKDLNLLNVLIDPLGLQIKLIDFGLSVHNSDSDLSPEGNFWCRPPKNNQIFQNPYNADLWCLHLILLSIILRKKMTTKKAILLTKETFLMEELSYFFYEVCSNIRLFLQEKEPNMANLKALF